MLKKIGLGTSALVLSLGLAACSDDTELVQLEDKTVVETNERKNVETYELDKIAHELVELTVEQKGDTFYLNVLNKSNVELHVFPQDVYINDTMGEVTVSDYVVKADKRLPARMSFFETEDDLFSDVYADLQTGDVVGFTVSVSDEEFTLNESIEIEFTVK